MKKVIDYCTGVEETVLKEVIYILFDLKSDFNKRIGKTEKDVL